MFTHRRKRQRGFTLIELVIVLAVLALLLSIALPRYLGARRKAFISEADNILQEMKTMAWAYYQEYAGWAGLTSANVITGMAAGLPPDTSSCWDIDLASDATASQIIFRATGDTDPSKCGTVAGYTITLTINGDGSATRSSSP